MTTKDITPFVEKYFNERNINDPSFIDHVNGVKRDLIESKLELTEENVYKLLDKHFNIVKKTCKELGLTYAQLGEQIGYKPDTVNSVASRGNISESMKKAIEMYLEIKDLKNQLNEYDELKKLLKKAIN